MFKLDIEVYFKNNFELIQAIFPSLGTTKSVYFFGTPCIYIISSLPAVFFMSGGVVTGGVVGLWESKF